MHNNKVKPISHFFLLSVIFLFSISCQNCTPTNAGSKSAITNDSIRDSLKVKKDTISKAYLQGKIKFTGDSNFAAVEMKYASRKGFYMHKKAYEAFKEMYDSAKKAGITLTILSAARTFNEQKKIWEDKWTGRVLYYGKNIATSYPNTVERSKYVLHYSSMPGTSRHHWGTDVDLNSMELSYFKSEAGKKMYNWLTVNAGKFGFCQPYTAKDSSRKTGYEEEKWHWSYFPVSSEYYRQYKERITFGDLKGFAGCETAKQAGVIENYVLSVNAKCR